MKIAIVDDEPIFLDKMVQICRDFCEEHRIQTDIASFISGESFLGQFEKNKFSIVFMDIYMEEMSGITVALKMRQKDNFCILVFLTSSSEFMPDAFSCHAFEYIVKPISKAGDESLAGCHVGTFPLSSTHGDCQWAKNDSRFISRYHFRGH